jgi:hypothetical protein
MYQFTLDENNESVYRKTNLVLVDQFSLLHLW